MIAPNAAALPYPIRPRGFALYTALLGSGFFVLLAVGFLALGLMTPGTDTVSHILLIPVVLLVSAFPTWRLWTIYRPEVVLYPERIEKRGLFGQHSVISRSRLKGVGETVYSRGGSYIEITSQSPTDRPIRLPASAREDPVVVVWLQGAPDPAGEAQAAERAAILRDDRFGVTTEQREARFGQAKLAVGAFAFLAMGATLWNFNAPKVPEVTLVVTVLVPLLAFGIVRFFDGLVVWVSASKTRPQVGAFIVLPGIGLVVRALFRGELDNPFPLLAAAAVCGLAVGALIHSAQDARDDTTALALTLGGGIVAATYLFGLAATADVAFDHAKPQVSVVRVQNRYETHGKSAANHLEVSGWPSHAGADLTVDDTLYNAVQIGDPVCIFRHPGALKVSWYESDLCPGERPHPPPVATAAPPTSDDIRSRYYPDRAQREEVTGTAEVECDETETASLSHCHALSESPLGYGFGDAAVRMLNDGQVKPAKPALGATTWHTTIRFRLQD